MRFYTRNRSPYFYVDVTIRGVRYRRPTGETDRRRAEKAARAIVAELERTAPPERRTDLGLLELMAADVARAESKGVSAAQIQSLRHSWDFLFDLLGEDRHPSTVTYDLVEDYVRRRRQVLTARGEATRGQTIRHETQALRRGLQVAKRRGWIREVPEFPTVRSDPPAEGQRGHLVPMEVIARFLDELHGKARDEAIVTLLTGLRCEELHYIEKSWIEPIEGGPVPAVLRVPAWASKTKRERIVGLTATALAVLERRCKDEAGAFPGDSSTHRQARAGASKRAKSPRAITLRDLRHTHSTIAGQSGDPSAIQAALGHTDLRTTNRYLSSTVERTTGVAASVDSALQRHTRLAHTTSAADRSSKDGVPGVETTGLEPVTSWLQTEPILPQPFADTEESLTVADAAQHGLTPIVGECWHTPAAHSRTKRKRLVRVGKSLAVIVDRELLDVLGFDASTDLEVSVRGGTLAVVRAEPGASSTDERTNPQRRVTRARG